MSNLPNLVRDATKVLQGFFDENSKQYTQSKPWNAYPVGTKVYANMGGYWEKIERGFKWCKGATSQTPGSDWCYLIEPLNTCGASHQSAVKSNV
jgi:hypothetical protein